MKQTPYGYYKQLLNVPYVQAVPKTTEVLKTEGLGIVAPSLPNKFSPGLCLLTLTDRVNCGHPTRRGRKRKGISLGRRINI